MSKNPYVAITNEDEPKSREIWGSPIQFFLSCLGFTFSPGTVLWFPILVFKNGGVAFMIAYIIMMFVTGLPMVFLEMVLGQYTSLGPTSLFSKLAPILSGLGWSMWVITAMVSIYQNMIVTWSIFYMFASMTSSLPWNSCSNELNSINCFAQHESLACHNDSMFFYNKTCVDIDTYCGVEKLQSFNETHCGSLNETAPVSAIGLIDTISASEDFYKFQMLKVNGTSWYDMGDMNKEMLCCLALAWLCACFGIIEGIKSYSKTIYMTSVFPIVALLFLLFRGITLEASYEGIDFYMITDFTKLWDIQIWIAATSQVFFSLNIGFGGLHTLASYNKLKTNCLQIALIVCCVNCLTSTFAGIMIFSILGFVTRESNVAFSDLLNSGTGLAFVTLPRALASVSLSPLWTVLFFAMLITMGLNSQFVYILTIATGLFDRFKILRSFRTLVIMYVCTVLFFFGHPMCLKGGVYLFELLNHYSAKTSVLFVAILELIIVAYCYGQKRLFKNISLEMGIKMSTFYKVYWSITWYFLTPISLSIILDHFMFQMEPAHWYFYVLPKEAQVLGFMATGIPILVILAFSVYTIVVHQKQKESTLFKSTKEFCPAYRRLSQHKGQYEKKNID